MCLPKAHTHIICNMLSTYIRGYYDKCLVANLLPMMRKYNVNAYFQGHRHSMEHNQEVGFSDPDNLHVFTVGSAALLEFSLLAGEPTPCDMVCL